MRLRLPSRRRSHQTEADQSVTWAPAGKPAVQGPCPGRGSWGPLAAPQPAAPPNRKRRRRQGHQTETLGRDQSESDDDRGRRGVGSARIRLPRPQTRPGPVPLRPTPAHRAGRVARFGGLGVVKAGTSAVWRAACEL